MMTGMRFAAVILIFFCAATAQVITVHPGNNSGDKQINLTLRPKLRITSASCAVTELEPGQSTPCTVAISNPAPAGGFTLSIGLPPGVTGNTSVVIAPGSASVTFTITYVDPDQPLAFFVAPREITGKAGYQPWVDVMERLP